MDIPKTQSIGEEAAAMKDRAVGTMKDKLGEATGSPDLERRGEAQNAAGQTRQASNTVVSGSAGDHYVTSFYAEPAAADRAYGCLREGDYAADDIDVVMSDDTRRRTSLTPRWARRLQKAWASAGRAAASAPRSRRCSPSVRPSSSPGSVSLSPVPLRRSLPGLAPVRRPEV